MNRQIAPTPLRLVMEPVPNIDLTKLCRQVRKQAGLTLNEIGYLLGTSWRTYARWEAGAEPSGRFLAKLFSLKTSLNGKRLVPSAQQNSDMKVSTIPALSPQDYYLGVPIDDGGMHYPNLKILLTTLADSQAPIVQGQLPLVFREICQLLFAHIWQAQDKVAELASLATYLASRQRENLDQLILGLFPTPVYHQHLVSLSCVPAYLKNYFYRKYQCGPKSTILKSVWTSPHGPHAGYAAVN